MAGFDINKRNRLEARFDKFLDDANISYIGRFGTQEHLFVAHASYIEGYDKIEFSLGTASADGFESKISIPISIDFDPYQVYGDMDSLLGLSDEHFNYWMTRALDYNSDRDTDVNPYNWIAKNEYPQEKFDLNDICPEILTETERVCNTIAHSDLKAMPYEEKINLAVQLTHNLLNEKNEPEAYQAFIGGLKVLDIKERKGEATGLINASIESAEYIITKIKNTSEEELAKEDFRPENFALETWIYGNIRNAELERELYTGFELHEEDQEEEKEIKHDFNEMYSALQEIKKKAEAFLKEKDFIDDNTGKRMYPVCISMTEHTKEEAELTGTTFTCSIILGSNLDPNTPQISLLANDKGDQLFDVASRKQEDFEHWLMKTMQKEKFLIHSETIRKDIETARGGLYEQSFQIIKESNLKNWSDHEKVAFGVGLTKEFIGLRKFEDLNEIDRYHKAIEELGIKNEEQSIRQIDLMTATNEGGEFLINRVMSKTQDELKNMNFKKFNDLVDTWEQADKTLEQYRDRD